MICGNANSGAWTPCGNRHTHTHMLTQKCMRLTMTLITRFLWKWTQLLTPAPPPLFISVLLPHLLPVTDCPCCCSAGVSCGTGGVKVINPKTTKTSALPPSTAQLNQERQKGTKWKWESVYLFWSCILCCFLPIPVKYNHSVNPVFIH